MAVRPTQVRLDRLARHGPRAALAGGLIAVLRFLPDPVWPLVPCLFRQTLERPCPFCGLTRAVRAAGQGQWAEAWHGAPLGALLYTLLAGYFLWNVAALFIKKPLEPKTPLYRRRWVWWGLAAAVLANWIYRWSMGFDRG